MAKEKEEKTNVMRLLEQKKIPYLAHAYPHEPGVPVDGVTVAQSLGQDPASVFKTLVTRGASGTNYVFVIPVADSLHLKKAAKAVGEKWLELIPVSELNALTGYVRGGCSPVGMKKQFTTIVHQSALTRESVMVSAGKIGLQVQLSPAQLIALVRGKAADVTV